MTIRRAWLVCVVLAASAVRLPAAQPSVMPEDFGFRLEFGCGPRDVIDTFNDEFVRDVGLPGQRAVIARVQLSAAEKAKFFELVSRIHFFDYPERFRPPVAAMTEPSNSYELRVRSGARSHTVAWDDAIGDQYQSKTPEAERLRDLLGTIIETFLAMPEVKRLPRVQVFCL